ncbi:hypothetical protein SAMN05216341_1254 [Leuconostocaceae bacterium R-53105]|uniref:Uncharacterized protein n=2 Tax=Convivina TaxID=1697027 RepID=A0A2U1D3S4_9LACO|nr:hypothetical protein C7384_1155 [Convivina intestini]CAH1854525.1 hypothetical protein R077815_01070 [Convivina sp. LMG 32447]CAH1855875.1 hypothetical protein LMG032447_01184 [Convivina sp. LMG 32447]CAH1857573.1 hypothetical protein R077811_01596 [Convivina intestini]SDC22605.1 hypothetical protein SAMN05216341_1254 [Leuconostocaceae bacterium R-53105]
MYHYSLIIDGRNVDHDFSLPFTPKVGDLINSSANDKDPYYLVKGVVLSMNDNYIQLHVQKFSNKLDASSHIDWFN